MSGDERTTIRGLIAALNEIAADLPGGFDAAVEIGICDGQDVRLIDKVDMDQWSFVGVESWTALDTFVLIRGHLHEPDAPGRLLASTTRNVDDELRRLTDDSE